MPLLPEKLQTSSNDPSGSPRLGLWDSSLKQERKGTLKKLLLVSYRKCTKKRQSQVLRMEVDLVWYSGWITIGVPFDYHLHVVVPPDLLWIVLPVSHFYPDILNQFLFPPHTDSIHDALHGNLAYPRP